MAAAIIAWLVFRGGAGTRWETLAQGAVILALAVAVLFASNVAVRERPAAPSGAGDDPTRARIAPFVIAVGTIGIVSLATAVIAFITIWSSDVPAVQQKLDTILLSVFTAVLSVFGTWVGTVLAFYFSNENFKTAAESTRRLVTQDSGGDPITDPVRMIPIDKITRIDLKRDQKAEDVLLAHIRPLFSATVTRVPIFDADKRVKYIIRKKLFDIVDTGGSQQGSKADAGAPGEAEVDDKADGPKPGGAGEGKSSGAKAAVTVADYLKIDHKQADATNFRFLPVNATVEDGRRIMKLFNTVDVFVTDHGTPSEPVKGWVTDDGLA